MMRVGEFFKIVPKSDWAHRVGGRGERHSPGGITSAYIAQELHKKAKARGLETRIP